VPQRIGIHLNYPELALLCDDPREQLLRPKWASSNMQIIRPSIASSPPQVIVVQHWDEEFKRLVPTK
jgi:hypothetical protein